MSEGRPLRLFEAFGVELEYMIVDADTLAVKPVADELLRQVGGGYDMEVDMGPVAWSNELALHVIEIKTNGPAPSLVPLGDTFQEHVGRIHELLEPMGARLLPGGMHPWMDPVGELRLWPHEDNLIYAAFDRIFDCRGHGWANLQSCHINFPFAGDDEFARLHAAIRMILPVLPALAASSPFADGAFTGRLDTRVAFYRDNARAVPSVTGKVVPERVFTRKDYEGELLRGIYDDLAPLDPGGVLAHEWVNARGCIARFDRMSIEIRLLDLQECPRADLAVAALVVAVVRALTEERFGSLEDQTAWPEDDLVPVLTACIEDGDEARIEDESYLRALGWVRPGSARAGDLWRHLTETTLAPGPGYEAFREPLEVIAAEGCLARRLLRAAGPEPDHDDLVRVYSRLAEGLGTGALFRP